MNEVHKEIDGKLQLLAVYRRQLRELRASYEDDLKTVRKRHEPKISNVRKLVDAVEKELYSLMKRKKKELFGERDLVELPSGRLVRQVQTVIHKARGVLKRLKELGRTDAIRVTESVNWQVLESWSDEELLEVGAYRKEKEEYGYEITVSGGNL